MKCLIELFIGKLKKLVQVYQNYQAERSWNNMTDEEQRRCCSGLSEEEWKKEQEYQRECEDARLQHWKEEAEREARQYSECERLKAEEAEVAREKEDNRNFERYHCQDCGAPHEHCLCGYEKDELDETTLIRRQCAEIDDEEEPASPEVEHWFTRCPKCSRYPEFCQCQ